ncbi:transmembrane protein 268-like isoform X2 [Scyliorhinus canicula]|uniref:transmembrane protein 268-like isoform X2 n=1 Tax=Scyliorhinus canicula TaxID=7830 RepID=UPI0018F759CB|nr:transmembrane protein 268-like isoform X2 [Scyliorhinus canicula]
MACGGGLAARYHSSQAPHSGPAEQDGAGQWLKVLHNGQVMLVLTSDGYYWSRSFDMDACARRLEGLGFQLPAGGYRNQIESSLMDSEIFYLTAWGNIYSIFHRLSLNMPIFYLLVSLGATVATIIMILLLDRYTKKVNINTDMRLAAVNEMLMNHNLLVGVTDTMEGFRSVIQLFFIYFDLEKCKGLLTSLLEQRKMDIFFQSELQKQLNHLYMIPGCAVTLDKEVQSQLVVTSEERPLLSNNSQNHKSKVIFSEVIDFVPQGTSEEVAHQLLITYSGVYVRLLVTDQLPPPPIVHHADQIPAPCLCQFIQNSVMNLKNTKEYNSCA